MGPGPQGPGPPPNPPAQTPLPPHPTYGNWQFDMMPLGYGFRDKFNKGTHSGINFKREATPPSPKIKVQIAWRFCISYRRSAADLADLPDLANMGKDIPADYEMTNVIPSCPNELSTFSVPSAVQHYISCFENNCSLDKSSRSARSVRSVRSDRSVRSACHPCFGLV